MKKILTACLLFSIFLGCGIKGKPLPPKGNEDNQSAIQDVSSEDQNKKKSK